jgi:hypothetical protein
LIKQLLIVFAIGLIVRKLLESSNPRAHRVGEVANRLMGNRFSPQPDARVRGRRFVRTRSSARA